MRRVGDSCRDPTPQAHPSKDHLIEQELHRGNKGIPSNSAAFFSNGRRRAGFQRTRPFSKPFTGYGGMIRNDPNLRHGFVVAADYNHFTLLNSLDIPRERRLCVADIHSNHDNLILVGCPSDETLRLRGAKWVRPPERRLQARLPAPQGSGAASKPCAG